MPNNISRSTAVGAILHPGGQRHHSHGHGHGSVGSVGSRLLAGSISEVGSGDGGYGGFGSFSAGGIGTGSGENVIPHEIDFLLAISSDEKLLTRLNEVEGAETVSTGGKGTDAKWRVESEEALGVLRALGRGSGSVGL